MSYQTCNQCGGDGSIDASEFGECGRHACYRCGATGLLPLGTIEREERLAREMEELFPERRSYSESEREAMAYDECQLLAVYNNPTTLTQEQRDKAIASYLSRDVPQGQCQYCGGEINAQCKSMCDIILAKMGR